MKKLFIFLLLMFVPFFIGAVEIKTEIHSGEITIGEQYEGISVADDNGYVVVGSYSNDALINKFNFNNELIWSKNFSGSGVDHLYDVEKLEDGFIIVGYSDSTDIKGTTSNGKNDAYIIRIDDDGELIWSKLFGGSEDDLFYDVEVLSDGSYVAVGYTLSKNLDGITFGNEQDGLIVRYDKNGDVLFTEILAGDSIDIYRGISSTKDGGYIVVGSTFSSDLGFVADRMGDGIIYKYNSLNQLVWKQKVGVSTPAITGDGVYGVVWEKDTSLGVYDIIEVSDGYVAVGKMQEQQATYGNGIYGGNVAMLFPSIMKYDFNGNYVWGKCLNDSGGTFYDVVEGNNNTYFVAGNVSNNINPVVINYSSTGEVINKYEFRGASYNAMNTSIEMLYNNYFIITGKYSGNKIEYVNELESGAIIKADVFNGQFDSYIFTINYIYNIEDISVETNGEVELSRENGLGIVKVESKPGFKVYKVKVLNSKDEELLVMDNEDGTYSFSLYDDVRVEVIYMENIENPKTFDSSFLIVLISLFFGGVVGLIFLFIYKNDKVSVEL